jgi:hypothetical protein
MGPARAAQATCLLDGPIGTLRARHVGLAAVVRLGGEISQWRWSRPCHGWHLIGPLSASSDLDRARSGVGMAPVGALRQLCGGYGLNIR